MSTAGREQVAAFIRFHREELVRIWRAARLTARADVFPGLLDGVVASFLDACSNALVGGDPPEAVWDALGGVVRVATRLGPRELLREWKLVDEVIVATCDYVQGEPPVRAWIEQASAHCRQCLADHLRQPSRTPTGVVTTFVYSPVAPRRVHADHDTNA